MDPATTEVITTIASGVASNVVSSYIIEKLPRMKSKKYGELALSASIKIDFVTSPYLSEALNLITDLFPSRERQREITFDGVTFSVNVSLFTIPILEIDDYIEDEEVKDEYEETLGPAVRRVTIFLYPQSKNDKVLDAVRNLYLKITERMSGTARTKLFVEIYLEDTEKAAELYREIVDKLGLSDKPRMRPLEMRGRTYHTIVLGFNLDEIDKVKSLDEILFSKPRFRILRRQP